MSLKERPAVLQQRNAEPHAAPLRAKIAQFESKGGVPVPRGLQSFGIGAPPPVDHSQQQRRGELYGNRMKPVWVPSVGPPSLATRTQDEGRGQRARKEVRQEVPDHLPSPPESPPVASASEPLSPASTVPQQFAAAEQDLPEQPRQEYVYEMPTIVVGDDEDDVLDDILEESDESPLPSPPPAVPQETKERLPPSPPAVVQSPSSPPLPPSPPLSPTEPPLPDPPHDVESVELEVNNEYGTILISPPPRVDSMAQRQGQTFTCVVHGRVREPPVRRAPVPLTQRTPEKRLPLPPPPSPGFASYSDLTALVENAAALERRLVAGELPADVIRRLSMRPPPVNTEVAPAAVVPLIQESEGEHGKTKHTFRNPLAKKRSRKLKEESDPAPHEETTWLTDAAHLTSWRKLASTSRHAKSPAVAPVH